MNRRSHLLKRFKLLKKKYLTEILEPKKSVSEMKNTSLSTRNIEDQGEERIRNLEDRNLDVTQVRGDRNKFLFFFLKSRNPMRVIRFHLKNNKNDRPEGEGWENWAESLLKALISKNLTNLREKLDMRN